MRVYRKKIAKTDARFRLSVSSRRLDDGFFELAAGERSREFVVVDADYEGQSWRFDLKIRSKGYRKPVISGGWLTFVRDKKVRPGDAVEFFKEYYHGQANAAESMRYRIRVMREIKAFKLFGKWHTTE